MIAYRNFWPGFIGEGSLLEDLVTSSLRDKADLNVNISSVFTFSSLKKQMIERAKVQLGLNSYEDYREMALYRHPKPDTGADINIWYTGENLRPPSDDYDLSISFDRTDLDKSVPNIYFPFWMYNINWGRTSRSDIREYFPTPAELMNPVIRKSERTDFCCAFFNNSEPVRLSLLQSLNKIAKVDTFGQLYNRPIVKKSDVASRYVFMLTPENSYYPGYITEKVFEARSVGCIPIWWGCNQSMILNSKAMIDATSLNTTDLNAAVKRVYNSAQLQEEMLAEPILFKTPEIQSTLDSMSQALRKFL
jgi:hypothetical protein